MAPTTVGKFLLRRLKEIGLNDIFGVPGDFVLGFFNDILESEVNYIGTCNELNAAYAADGYARINGIGAAAFTYAVGEISALNGIAGAWAENVPVVVITGCPTTAAYKTKMLLHHTLGDYDLPRKMFECITAKSIILNDPSTAAVLIDTTLRACLQQKRPVYVGICSDIVSAKIEVPTAPLDCFSSEFSDKETLKEAVLEAAQKINAARTPVLIPGLEIIRRKLGALFLDLLEKSGLPFATMMLGKTAVDEEHPQNLGLYCGDRSRVYVQQYIENSDCVVLLGEKLTDYNTGGFTALLNPLTTVHVNADHTLISYHKFQGIYLDDVIKRLSSILPKRYFEIKPAQFNCVHRSSILYEPRPGSKLSMNRFFDRMSTFIPKNAIVIAETGTALFSVCEILMPKGVTLIAQSFYGSIGFSVGACLGACASAAGTSRTIILFVGDGSFQMTCQAVSTIIRNGYSPIIFLINNDGYTIERVICDNKYNDIQMWKYSELPAVFGKAHSFKCFTEDQLEKLLNGFPSNPPQLFFVEVIMDKWDCNESLRRAGEAMSNLNKLKKDAAKEFVRTGTPESAFAF